MISALGSGPRRRVLVCSSGGVRNVGDDAILLRTIERIRSVAPKARVDVLTDEEGPIPNASGARTCGTNARPRVDPARYDVVLVAGGGYACDWFASHVTSRALLAASAAAAGVPVIVTGQGIGPLSVTDPIDALAEMAQSISVRDELSRELAPNAVLTGDDALGLGGGSIASAGARLLVHVRHAWYHADDHEMLRAWSRAASKVATTRNLNVVGLAVNDRPDAPERETLRSADIETIVDATADPRLLVAHTRHAQGVVAHSYHVALFALAAGVPAVLAAASPYYEQKAEGLRRLAEVSDAFVAREPPTPGELADRLDAVRADLRGNNALARATARVDEFFSREWAKATGAPPRP